MPEETAATIEAPQEPELPSMADDIALKAEMFLAVVIDGFLMNLRTAQNIPAEMLLRGLTIACGRQMSLRSKHPEDMAVTLRVRAQMQKDFEAMLRKHTPALAAQAKPAGGDFGWALTYNGG